MSEPTTLHFADGVEIVKNIMIPVRDGVRLAADLYMPDNADIGGPFPVVVEYHQSRKDDVNVTWRPFYLTLPRQGYVLARVDKRGTGASEGVSTDEYLLQEQLDGFDVVEWLAVQPWCDGHVNIMGISYGGSAALQVALQGPPHLTSIIPIDFSDDRYADDCHYRGGLMRKYYDIAHYGGLMVTRNAMPPNQEWLGAEWAQMWEERLSQNKPWLPIWYRHQTDGEYWRDGSVRDAAECIQCPVFLIGGWHDGYTNPPLRLYQALQVPCKVLVGPWNHDMPDVAIPGPRIDYLHEVVRWLDFWCKGVDTGIMDEPPVVVYMQRYAPPALDRLDIPGEWRAETAWPVPGAGEMTFYLGERHSLQESVTAVDNADTFDYNPAVGLATGLWSGGILFGLSGDQRLDEALSLVYTSQPLQRDVHILGRPRAVLNVSSSATVMGFAASLCDVAPDGTSHLVAKGMLNATRCGSLSEWKPLTPGEIYLLDIQLDCCAWVFVKGHRIRLSIASADWPNVWPTPELATNHVHRGRRLASRLILPTVPPQGSAEPPMFRPSTRTVRRHSDATRPPTWQTTRDLLTGVVSVDISNNSSWRVDDRRIIEREAASTFTVDPRDPAHASARGKHVYRLLRPNLTTQALADIGVQATATHFHITVGLEVQVNNVVYFTERWIESVPREGL